MLNLKSLIPAVLLLVLTGLSHAQMPSSENSDYTLIPSKETINTHVSLKNEGYGVNVLLHKNGSPVLDQSKVKYVWEVANPEIISLTDWKATTGCTHGIKVPCPNNTADLKALKTGTTSIYVVAYVNGVKSAAKTINVVVSQDWRLEFKTASSYINKGETYLFELQLSLAEGAPTNKVNKLITDPDVEFSLVETVIGSPNLQITRTDNRSFIVKGLITGKSTLQATVANYNGAVLDSFALPVEIVSNPEVAYGVTEETDPIIYLNTEATSEPHVADEYLDLDEEHIASSSSPLPYYEDNPMNQQVEELQSELVKQQSQLEEQNKKITEQAARLSKTESLLQKLLNRVKKLFGGV